MATNKMEVKEIAKHKTLWKMSSTSEPLFITGIEVSPLKKFTIPKIKRRAGKVYLSPCCTNTREYSFIHDTLNQCRLDISCDLQSSWQFGDTKLIHNEDLEKNFTAKRSEMRERRKHGRELEEHFCFLALPQSDVLEIYQNGISTKASTLKILGNPHLGIYIFRHVDVALNYAHSRNIMVENIIIFKVLFGRVKKIQPSMDKNKVSLDPSPNFDCHMSRSLPSVKDTIELQAYSSAVYFYEYNIFSKPVDKPRQCLPYAIVTVKFIGHKVDSGHFMASLRFLSAGLPKKAERTCSLNNCTVAKRIGKGKDATVIFEHFRKPVDPFVEENCSCNALNSEINPSNSSICNSYGNVQNGNISVHEAYSGKTENNFAEIRDCSQIHEHDSGLSLPSDNRKSDNGDLLLNLTYLKNILSGISATFPPHNNTGSSTVTTSKLIKDPRLMKREESLEKQNITDLSEILPFEKSVDYDNSEINLSSVPANSVSSPEVTSDHTILTNCLDVSCFRFFDDSQPQTQNTKDHHQTAPNNITMAEQCKDHSNLSFPIYFSNVVSEVENQKHSKEKAQRAQERSSIPLLIKQSSETHNSYKSASTCTEEYNSYISQESQSIAEKLMELKLEKTNKNCVSIMTDAFQEAKDIPQAEELYIDGDITSHAIETSFDNSNCNIIREYVCAQRKSENEPVSLENIQRDCKETPHIEDEGQDHILFCNTQLNNDTYLNTDFKGQGYNDKENENEAEEEDSASSPENIKDVCGGKKQGFHTDNTLTNISERRDSKNYNQVEILSSQEFSTTFNLVWGDKDKSTETALLESEDTVIAPKQREKQSTESVEHLDSTAFLELADSSVGETSDTTVEVASTSVSTLSTNYEGHQRFEFKDTCFESPGFDSLVKHGISDDEIDMDKNKLKDSFHQSINENSVLQCLELQSEIEIESEQCDAHGHGNVLHEEVEASYEALMSRIDWKGLLGSKNGEMEVLESTTKNENIGQHCSKKICFYSSTENEELHPVLLPDLQVRITNMYRPGFNPNDDSLVMKDNPYKYITQATNPEIDEKGEAPDSQPPSESSGYPCEDKFGNSMPDSGITNKYEISHSSDLSHNAHANHISEKQNSGSWSTKPSNTTIVNDECRYFFTKSKSYLNDTKSKKDPESRISKRKLHAAFRDENIPHEICGKKRKLTSQDSFECFSSLSQGRIKIFSQSERHIRSVLDILNSEASLCKSKRLSRTLDKAVLHLKKAHRRVHTSLQLIAKVGEKRKGPLPKAYAIICNSFWESCDLQGYNSVSERRYYSTKHFLSKRKYDKPEDKRTLGFDVDKSLACVSKNKSYKANGEKITKYHSKKRVATSVSKSHTTIHVSELYDVEQHPESQLPLFSTSQSVSQSEYDNSLRHSRSSELQPFSGRTECLLYPDDKLTKKENQIDIKVSNSKYKKLENHSARNNIKDVTKENNSDTNKIINESSSDSFNCIKENNLSYNTDRNYEGTCIAHTKMKTDISVSHSNMKHFLSVGIYKQNLLSSGCKRNLEVNVPTDKWTAPTEICKSNIITGNFLMGPLNFTSVTNTKYSTPQLLSTTPVIEEGKSSKSYLDKQRIFALDSSTSSTVSHCQQIDGEKELLTEQCSSSNCFLIDEDETNGIEYSELDQTSVTEKIKSYGENTMNKLCSNGSSPLLKDNIKCSSKKSIADKDIQDRKIRKIEQAEKEDSVYKKGTTEGLTVKCKNQNKILKEESSQLNMKKIKSSLVDSHVSIKNSTEGVSTNNTIFDLPNKRKAWGIKVSNDSQPDCVSRVGIQGSNCVPFLHTQSEACEVTALQKPISYMNELNDKHCSINHTALIAELSQILQRSDEASSLQILEEETKICQNILPLFVEAFERKQECSLEQILISRELLVEQNLWNNCKYQLNPCAVEALVELQMVMETIQFIENKKRLLKGEPTFRSLLWYDETLYSELLGRPRGYQLQSSFYSAFQGRLKYNAFCELQSYCNQLFAKTKKKNNSYYVFLKYQRQINECEAILKHCSDCFDFSLSIPFTCGVNCGNSLGDLETLRKSTLKLISKYEDSPKVYTYPGKQDHLWIILDLISSKVKFIKSTEAATIKISLYGLEHIFFNAAKNLVWKERGQSFSKNKDVLLKMNECALSKLQEIHDTLSKDLNSEPTSNIGLEADTMISFRKSHDIISMENYRFNSTLFSHTDICCISEILDQAEFADLKKLQELILRCTDHLEILKKYFQMLQEVNIDNIFITEENALDVLQNHNHGAVILKPEAVETYIEIVMLSETVHFLKNSMAKKLDNQRFRGMLWFDLSLLPELLRCQEKMASFSFLKDNQAECLCNVIETAISELEKNLDIICKYNEAVNCSYALHLFSRELEELSEIKKLLKSEYCLPTYIDFVPYTASINYGNTVTELEHNYDQFSILLKNIMSVPQKDVGKMAHIMKVMKTIEHMKIICAKNAKLTTSFMLCQMAHNRRNAFQLKKEEKMNIHVTIPEENRSKSGPMKVPSISECVIKNFSNSSKKQPISIDKCGDYQEEEKNITSCCKKQKVSMNDVTKIYKEESAFKQPRTTRSLPRSENEIGSNPSDNLKRNYVSPKMVGMQSSLLPLKFLQNTCTSRSESKIDLTNSSSGTSEHPTRQQEVLKKRNVSFSVAETKSDNKECAFATCDQRSIDDAFMEDLYTTDPTQKTCLSNINPGTDDCPVPNATMVSKPIFHFLRDIHTNLKTNDMVLEHQDNEMLNSSIKNSTCINSPESTCIQGKVSILQENEKQPAKTESEEKYMKSTLKPSTTPSGQAGILTLGVNQRVEYSFSEQQHEDNLKVLNKRAATYWNEPPQSACNPVYNSSEHSFGTSYPYYSWCVYHYSSSNGNAITHTYQGIESYEVYPPPSGILTTVASTVQTTHSNILYSQYFSYFAEQPQANAFMPVNGYFPSQSPISYNFQQPIFSQYASHQPLPQAAYPYPPNPGVLQEVPWIYAPCQQEQFQPGH